VGQTILVLEEPLVQALAEVEGAPDEVVVAPPAPPADAPATTKNATPPPAPPSFRRDAAPQGRAAGRWTVTDLLVMGAALGVLVASLAGLAWLLRS
jgi:hypothetical protein